MANAARPSLFPIGAGHAAFEDVSDNEGSENLDWLQNASYVPTAAASELEEVLASAETQQSRPRSSPISIGDSSDDDLEVQVEREKDETAERYKQHQEKKKKKKKKLKGKYKSEETNPKTDERKEAALPFLSGKTFIEDIPGLKAEHAFRLDPKVDRNLWVYDSVSNLHLSKYRLSSNYVLGADKDLKVTAAADGGHSKHKHKPHSHRYFAKVNQRDIRTLGQYVQPIKTDKHSPRPRESYIPLSDCSTRNIPSSSSVDPMGIMDHATTLYIEGKGVATADSSAAGGKEESCFDETIQKVASYNRRLREDPCNVSLWLEFVHFQEKISSSGSKSRTLAAKLGEAQPRSRAMLEKQLAILDRALSANPGNIPLKMTQMQLWEELWEPAKVDKEWEQLLFVHSGDGQLWRRYLSYQQSRLSSFSASRVTKLYHKAFLKLLALAEGRMQAARIPHDLHQELLYLFVQYCHFLQQSGHMEKAVATYQALLEFNLACPPSLSVMPTADRVAVFECFWDSSVARLGEEGAQGWKLWAETKGETQGELSPPAQADTEEAEDAVVNRTLPQWQTWLEIECLRDAAHVLPWRPDLVQDQTVEDCEDLDRLVLIDDIAPVLFPLQGENEAFVVLLNFLKMLGLRTDQLLSCHGFHIHEVSSLVQLYDVPQVAALDCGASLDHKPKPHPVQINLIRQLLKQALGLFSGHHRTHLSLLLLQLEKWQVTGSISGSGNSSGGLSKAQARELRKFAKNLLKEEHNRSNLLVWNAYAELEAELGKKEDAVGIVETALGMFSGNGPLVSKADGKNADSSQEIQSLGLCTLYQTHAVLLLNFHPNLDGGFQIQSPSGSASSSAVSRAAASLACLANRKKFQPGQSLSPFQMLECQAHFWTLLSEMVDDLVRDLDVALKGELVLKLVDCAALFHLCSDSLQAAVDIYVAVLDRVSKLQVSDKSQTVLNGLRERLHQSQIRLITNAMCTSSVSMAVLRTALTRALESFPHSPMLLQCLVQVEARCRIAGRLQRYFDQALKTGESALPTVFAVLAFMVQQHALTRAADLTSPSELAASLPETGLLHRTRALFERGLQHSICQHCPLVWRLYLAFEAQHGKRERAKGIFYRALQLCPWAKELYKDGIREFHEEELQELVMLMTEKEIRVQIPLEEVDLLLETPVAMETT